VYVVPVCKDKNHKAKASAETTLLKRIKQQQTMKAAIKLTDLWTRHP